MLLRNTFTCTAALLLLVGGVAWGQDAKPTEAPKCSAVPVKNFPAVPPAAAAKQGRVAGCVPAKACKETDDVTKTALGTSFCAMNNYTSCYGATCDKSTLACMTEFRPKTTKGMKLSNCVSRPSKIACPKDGEEICLCDVEVEAKGVIQCGCSCQIAPTPSPTAR